MIWMCPKCKAVGDEGQLDIVDDDELSECNSCGHRCPTGDWGHDRQGTLNLRADMGEIADDMVSGRSCSRCGIYFQDEHGYPVVCIACFNGKDPRDRDIPLASILEA